MNVTYTTERMSDQFSKLNLQLGNSELILHHFTGPDLGDPHDHPLSFITTILTGGYIEEIWTKTREGWMPMTVHRRPGTTHLVPATQIHKIIELPEGECITAVRWLEAPRREPRFWRFENKRYVARSAEKARAFQIARSRQWNEPHFA